MSKKAKKNIFVCSGCGHTSTRWLGRCTACQAWDTFVEEAPAAATPSTPGRAGSGDGTKARPITEITPDASVRMMTGVPDLDRILGGGLVAGSAVLVGGEPGIGKSTMLLQVAHWLAEGGHRILYVTAEESAIQLRIRAERLACLSDNLLVVAENNLDTILAAAELDDVGVLIIDSIQMVHWEQLASAPGSVGQVRECAAALIAQAKRRGVPLFLVGHITKDGSIAGPKVLEHMVDVVLHFEGDRFHAARILRATKNRYGAVNEIGVFEMTGTGLSPVLDPSQLFLSGRQDQTPGTVVTAPLEGSRPFLVEVQALVAPAMPGRASRRVSGVDSSRAAMILAVLEKRCSLVLSDQDVFLNVVGGAQIPEPGGDLALALAIASSLRDRVVAYDTVVLGELGLGGEIRPVAQLDARLAEAARLGFTAAITPTAAKTPPENMVITPTTRIETAMEILSR